MSVSATVLESWVYLVGGDAQPCRYEIGIIFRYFLDVGKEEWYLDVC